MTLDLMLILAIGAVAGVGLIPLLAIVKHNRKIQRVRERLEEASPEASPRDSREYPWSDYKGRRCL